MKTVYVGMGLTLAPVEFREDFQNELKTALRRISEVEVMDFIGLTEGTEVDVYNHDRQSAESADLCVFIADHPSIGLGLEIAFRVEVNKPFVVFAHTEAKVTRMLLGLCEKHQTPLIRYQTVSDIVAAVETKLVD